MASNPGWMTDTASQQHRNDHRLKHHGQKTGEITIANELLLPTTDLVRPHCSEHENGNSRPKVPNAVANSTAYLRRLHHSRAAESSFESASNVH